MAAKKTSRPVVYDMTSEECIWSAAGLVPYRLCDNAFDCTTCTFDQRMLRKREEGISSWREKARMAAHPEMRRCRHMRSGYISAKYCPNDFDCGRCEFDQLVDEEMLTQPAGDPVAQLVEGFALAPDHYYGRGHTWARVEYGGQVRIGLDDFAARLLGPADGWDLPGLGSTVAQNETCATLTRSGATASLRSPLQGIVVAVNPWLEPRPGLVNSAPYGEGWLMILQPTRLVRNLRQLLCGDEVAGWLADEAERLSDIIYREQQYRLAATGGRVVPDIFGSVKGLQWDELVRSFLMA